MTLIEDLFTDDGVDHASTQPRLHASRCCAEAFDEVREAFWSFSSGAAIDEAAVARHLRHDHVAHELVDELGSDDDAPAFVAFAEAVAGAVRDADAGGAWLLAGLAHLGAGNALDAEACLEQAMRCEPALGPAAGELAMLALDRGDLARTARLVARACCSPIDPESVRRHQQVQLAGAIAAGRNDPCPCGSGRKFKRCCDGHATASLKVRSSLMMDRLGLYASHPDRRPILLLLAAASLRDGDTGHGGELADRADDLFLVDLANFEGGLALDYLAERGELLADDERDLLERALEEPRQLWKITAVDEGASMDLHDATSGRTVTIQERSGSRGRKPGEHLLARVVRCGDTWVMLGMPLLLDPANRRGLRALLTEEPGVLEWSAWYGGLLAPPQLRNREGEPLVLCRSELAAGRPEGIVPVLDELLEAAGDGVWCDEVELAQGDVVLRGTVSLEEDLVVVQTNSQIRQEWLVDALTAALDAEVLTEERRDALDMCREHRPAGVGADGEDVSWRAGDPDMPPEAAAALEEYMIDYERAWVDRSLPALGGLTPRQAVDDPRHRPDLDDLLEEIAERAAPGLMSPKRIRELLGLTATRGRGGHDSSRPTP